MSKNSAPFIATKQKISNMKNAGFEKCNGCMDEFCVGDVVVSSTNNRYHYRCAKCCNLI